MQRSHRTRRAVSKHVSAALFSYALASIASPDFAAAQAWVPPAGVGAITVSAQNLDYSGHRVTDGTFFPVGMSVHNRVDVDVDYAITNRVSVTFGLPFVFAKYTDPNPLPPFVPFLPVDECRCWQSGFQDLAFTARYNLKNGAFGLTPSIAVGVPSHEYNFQGEAALGERLREMRLTIDAGQRLDVISPRLSIEGRYSYAFVQQTLDDVPNNRSNAAVEGSFVLMRQLVARGMLAWQRVHGGLRLGSPSGDPFQPPGEVNSPERLYEHDRLLRDNNFRLGFGVSFSTSKFDLFGSYIELLRGTDTHGGRAITGGISFPFEISRAP